MLLTTLVAGPQDVRCNTAIQGVAVLPNTTYTLQATMHSNNNRTIDLIVNGADSGGSQAGANFQVVSTPTFNTTTLVKTFTFTTNANTFWVQIQPRWYATTSADTGNAIDKIGLFLGSSAPTWTLPGSVATIDGADISARTLNSPGAAPLEVNPIGGGTGGLVVGDGAGGSGLIVGGALKLAGLTGAATPGRQVGFTAAGAPTSGTFLQYDYVLDLTGVLWICSVAGTPGTWIRMLDPLGFGFPFSVDPRIFTGGFTALAANQAWFLRCFGGGTITKIGLHIGVSSGNVCVGVYDSSGTGRTAVPNNQKGTSGSVACPVAGYAEIALTGSVSVAQGDWLALTADNATATFGRLSMGGYTTGLTNGICTFKSSAFPLPSPAGASSSGSGASWVLAGVP